MSLLRSGFLDKARKEAASALKCQSLRSLGPARLEGARACDDVGRFAVAIEVSKAFGARGNFAAPNLGRAQVFLK